MAKVGETLPNMVLEAAATKRSLSLPQHGAELLIVLFYSQQEAEQAKEILMQLRMKFHDVEQLKIINIIDATAVPRLMRGAAKGMIGRVYKRAAEEVPAQFDPADVLFFTVDWDGSLHKNFAVPTKHGLQMIIADTAGHITKKGPIMPTDELLSYTHDHLA